MLVNKKQALRIQEQSQEEIKKRIKMFDEGMQERVQELVDKELKPIKEAVAKLRGLVETIVGDIKCQNTCGSQLEES